MRTIIFVSSDENQTFKQKLEMKNFDQFTILKTLDNGEDGSGYNCYGLNICEVGR